MKYTYECKGQIKELKDQETKIVHGNMFCVVCNCCNIPVLHLLDRTDSFKKRSINMDFSNDNYPLNEYDADTTLRIKGVLFDLLKEVTNDNCVSCGKHLNLNYVNIYDHEGGWGLIGSIPKQWVSVPCSCGYHNSLNKLGVHDRRF